jgi:hypothetical protein
MKKFEASKYKDEKRRLAEEKKVKKAETKKKRENAVLKDYVLNQKFTKGNSNLSQFQSKINREIDVAMRYA